MPPGERHLELVTDESPAEPATAIDTTMAHQARVYNYWLGGKDNYAADRAAAEQAIEDFPKPVRSVTSTAPIRPSSLTSTRRRGDAAPDAGGGEDPRSPAYLDEIHLGVVRLVVNEMVAGRAVPAGLDRGTAGGMPGRLRRVGVPGPPVRQ
jgi:hypothetical protein